MQRDAKQAVLVIGSVNADVVVEVRRLPRRGETVSAARPDTGTFAPGGKGSNQAAAAGKLLGLQHPTLDVRFIGQFGRDAHGTALQNALCDAHVHTELCGHVDGPSGQALVFVYPNGDNSIVVIGGANCRWPEALPEAVVAAIESAAIVLLQCEIPEAVNALVVKAAARAAVPVMWDAGGDDVPLRADLLPHLTYLCPNETELARLTQREVHSVDDAMAAAQLLQAQGAKNVLVTLGADGAVFVPADGSNAVHQKCFQVDTVVDTTGAGDCFRGAFAVALAEGQAVKNCMVRATAASALCVQRRGALPSLPTSEEVNTFLAELGMGADSMDTTVT